MKNISRFRRIRLKLRVQGLNLKSQGGKLVVDYRKFNNLDEVATVHDKPHPAQKRNTGMPTWAQYSEGSLTDRLTAALRWGKKREKLHKRRQASA